MAKRLSILQKNILALCLEQRFITSQELLSALWDLQPQEQGTQETAIAKAQYASAHSSLSRTLTKLWIKNLIEQWKTINRSKTGITLTRAGQRLIEAILEESEDA
jgi:DNA-binding MarR family transcriptional regulator